jgi:hypothetical protein
MNRHTPEGQKPDSFWNGRKSLDLAGVVTIADCG